MAKFCGKCGTALDTTTGLCPNCDKEKLQKVEQPTTEMNMSGFCHHCGNVIEEQNGICLNPDCNGGKKQYTSSVEISENISTKKKKSAAMTIFVTVLLSICLFLTSLLALTIYDARNAVKDKNAEKLFKNVSFTNLLNSNKLNSENDLKNFYDFMSSHYEIEITDEQFDNFINKSTVKGYLASKTSVFCDDIFSGEAELRITNKDVENILEDNSEVVKDIFGVYLSESDSAKIADWIVDDNGVVTISTNKLKDDAPAMYYIIKIGLSYITMAILIVLAALVIFFMIRNNLSQATFGIGIVFVVLGALMTIVAILASWITPLWSAICSNSFIGMAIGNLIAINILISAILLAIGIVLIVIRNIVLKHRANKNEVVV